MEDEKIIELRLKCLEPFVKIAAKTGIEQGVVFKQANAAWNYAIAPLADKSGLTLPKTESAG